METTDAGIQKLSQITNQLASIVQTNDEKEISNNLEKAQKEDTALSKTIMGVPKSDLKAAALLIAFSQLRTSLDREEPFNEDLELLKNLLGESNKDLQDNIQRLSTHANGGCLLYTSPSPRDKRQSRMPSSA